MYKFEFTYAEVITIYSALNLFIDKLKADCEKANVPDMYKESIAFNLKLKLEILLKELKVIK